jgi:large subunit ribosomal protein L35
MPKMKTKRAVVARFRVTATGKLTYQKAGLRHILTKKTGKRKQRLSKPAIVSDAFEQTYKRAMCVN